LAAGVVARVRAEAAQSWRVRLSRAVDDCRWLLVATGSALGTVTTTLFVSAVLTFGPAPEREDSLAALLSNLSTPAGALFIVGASGDISDQMLIHVQLRSGIPSRQAAQVVFATPTEPELAMAFSEAVVREGELIELAAMLPAERQDAEALMDAIRRRGSRQVVPLRGGPLAVSQVRLVTSTGVSVKGL
jgi:hypothetical protein